MGFPWGALLTMIAVPMIFLLIGLSPAIFGALIGQIIRFFRNLFGGKDDDDI